MSRKPRGVKTVLHDCMNVKKSEDVLIVTDYDRLEISNLFLREIQEIGAKATLVISKPSKFHGGEPNKMVSRSLQNVDVGLLITTKSITHTDAVRDALAKGKVRIASMPGITKSMLSEGGLAANYKEVEKITKEFSTYLKDVKRVKVTTELGTNLEMDISGRKIFLDTGLYHNPGDMGNLPAGEVFVAPIEGTTKGVLIVDGTMLKKLTQPIQMEIKNGKVISIKGGKEAEDLKGIISEADKNATNIAEFGIGTNPKARLIGNMLEDEKVLGTIHIAIGDNKSMGGSIYSNTHIDGIVKKPNVEMDGKRIIKKGILLEN